MDWRKEAERLRVVAGRLQDENDRLHHDLADALERLDASHWRIVERDAEIDALRAVRRVA